MYVEDKLTRMVAICKQSPAYQWSSSKKEESSVDAYEQKKWNLYTSVIDAPGL